MMVLIQPEDQHLLEIYWISAMMWKGRYPLVYLCSAPKIFSTVADVAQQVLQNMGISFSSHNQDNFILVAKSTASEPNKLEGPLTCLAFLGIKVDTEVFKPHSKQSEKRFCLCQCVYHPSVRKRDLEHLTGLPQFVIKVVCPGRPFLRCLYGLQNVGSQPDHIVRQ